FHRTYRDLVAGGFRQRSGGTPGRDAVVLDLLDAGNEYRVQRRPFLDLSNMLLRGLDEALGCGVFLLRHILFELAESRLELAQESLTMLRAQLDQLPELLRLNRFRKGRQNARQVAFRTLNLLQLECKKLRAVRLALASFRFSARLSRCGHSCLLCGRDPCPKTAQRTRNMGVPRAPHIR